MAFVAVFQPPPDDRGGATFITMAFFLGIGTGGVFAWVACRAAAIGRLGHRDRRAPQAVWAGTSRRW